MGLEETIRKHCLKNCHDYFRADPKAIVGKVIAEYPDAKKDMRGTMQLIARVVDEVNRLPREQLEAEMKKFTYLEKKIEERKKITLPDAEEGKVVTRFPPEPNGHPHIGHAKAVFLDREGADSHKGKMLLRFDDTNPEAEQQEYVDVIKRELNLLMVRWEEELYASDFMPEIYKHAEQLISQGDGYACNCKPDEVKANRAAEKECACRKKGPSESLEVWRKMLAGEVSEGEFIIRFKGDMQSKNTVMRDPYLFRILKAPHYRQGEKYKAWPSYDFQAPVLDSINGVTHAMRSKEYELRDELYFAILDKLKLRKPKLIEFSRLAIKGAPISKRLLKPLIEEKKVMGWDDPRLPTLEGLRRRGILPEAIKAYVLSFGLSKVESEPGWDGLLTENKRLLNDAAPHYFFVKEPVAMKVANASGALVKLKKHPSADLGIREVKTGEDFFISKDDADALKQGESVRLKELASCKLVFRTKQTMLAERIMDEVLEGRRVQWVPKEGALECEILVPGDLFIDEKFNEQSLRTDKGLCEPACAELDEGSIVHFERYGFCRLDEKKDGLLRFIFTCPL